MTWNPDSFEGRTVPDRSEPVRGSRTRSARPPTDLECVVVRYVDAPDEYTVFPRNATDTERITSWMTVTEGGLVHLEDAR